MPGDFFQGFQPVEMLAPGHKPDFHSFHVRFHCLIKYFSRRAIAKDPRRRFESRRLNPLIIERVVRKC
jgi:hypothetical protein